MRGFNGFTDRQVGMGALQPTVSIRVDYEDCWWGFFLPLECWRQAVTVVYSTLSTTLTCLC